MSSNSQGRKRQQDQVETSLPKKRNLKATAIKAPASTSLLTPLQSQALPQKESRTSQVKLHFFTTNECLGAVPVPFEDCNSADDFFARAASVCSLLSGQEIEERIAAVYVVMEGLRFPMILEWKNAQAYQTLVAEIAATTARTGNILNVEVKCILR